MRGFVSRRAFLQASALAGAGVVLGGGTVLLDERRPRPGIPPWGPLVETRDRATGLPLLRLPDGFSYVTYGWAGDPLGDASTPGAHDGMGVVRVADGRVTLVRNHEVRGEGAPFAKAAAYDSRRGGGTTTLTFDLADGRWLAARPSLVGTVANCAGGVTPWGTWLTCEENLTRGDDPHGFVFEVQADGEAIPEPLTALGRFTHEAVVVDPATSIVYETEDHGRAGVYRFVPNVPGELRRGGRLQMLRVVGRPNLRLARRVVPGTVLPIDWVDIAEPQRAHGSDTGDGNGVFWQGHLQGAASFSRLEGCWWGDGGVYFVSTDGGEASKGQVWHLDVQRSALRLVLEAGQRCGLDAPDVATSLPSGDLLVSEDTGRARARLVVASAAGAVWPFAENAITLAGERNGLEGDYSDGAWTGIALAGGWLFANIEHPGLTVAITGPWDRLRIAV